MSLLLARLKSATMADLGGLAVLVDKFIVPRGVYRIKKVEVSLD